MLLPARDSTAETAARLVHDRWICTFDVPLVITSDRGPHFAAETFRAMCRRIGVRHRMGAPLHAQSQGQVERQNQLVANLRCVCSNDVRVWPDNIYQLQFSHNTSVNAATGYSPFELLFARPARRPESAFSETVTQGAKDSNREVTDRRHQLDELHHKVQVSVHEVQNARVQRSVTRARGQPFEVGDLVRLRLSHAERSRKGGKLSPVLSPIYKVAEVLRGGWTYRLNHLHGRGKRGDVKVRHYNDLVCLPASIDREEAAWRDSETATAPPTDPDSGSTSSSGDSDDGSDSEGHDYRGSAGSRSRPRRTCGPPARLVIDPARKRYEEV